MVQFQETIIGYENCLLETGNIALECGKFYSLIGKNGVGKTTLFNTILGHIPAFGGKILIDGKNIHLTSASEKAKIVAHVASRFEGVQHLSARDYIAMGRAPYTNFLGKMTSKDWLTIDAVIEQLQIAHLSKKDTAQLSDGERQIASIAKALVQKTSVILLDEPTAFLDYANRLAVQKLLKEIACESNICILQSSHDLELCIEFSDNLLVVNPTSKRLIELKDKTFSKNEVIQLAFPHLT